jgi:hypothetical protein
MNVLSYIVQSIITKLPEVSSISNLDMVERRGYFYVYFDLNGKRYRVDQDLSVEIVEGCVLTSDSFSRIMQYQLRG